MKFAILTSTAFLLAVAGTVPALAAEDPSGRPSAVLNKDQCQQVWQAENKDGALRNDRVPILNFPRADKDDNGKIDQAEFDRACELGWVAYAPNGSAKTAEESSVE